MDVDRHCDVSSSRTKMLEGYASRDLFLAEERKKWNRSYVLSLEQDKEKNLDRSSQLYLISMRSFSYEQFLMSRYDVSHPSTRFLKLNSSSTEEARSRSGKSENSRRVSSTRCPWTVHLFSRNVTLALSDGNNRSGTANWPRGLIATNCSITRVHTLERIVARIQLLLAYTATRDRGSYRCTLGRIVFQRRKPVTREWYASYQDA